MFRLVVLSLLPGDEDVRKEVAIQVIANQTVVQSEVLYIDKRCPRFNCLLSKWNHSPESRIQDAAAQIAVSKESFKFRVCR